MADTSSSNSSPPETALLEELVQKIRSGVSDQEREGSKELRKLAKFSSVNRICIAEAGAIPWLIKVLRSNDSDTQAHSIAALLNLTLRNEENKRTILMAHGLEPIVEALQKGILLETRENAAALLFNLSCTSTYRTVVSSCQGVFTGLVRLLTDGGSRGKKDAAAALFNLLQIRNNRALAVRAGAVRPLLQLAQDLSSGLVDESLTVLLNLANHQEGRFAIRKASGIRIFLDLLSEGSDSNKEYACSVLLLLCNEDYACVEEVCNLGGQNILLNLCIRGTERAQRKAAKIVELLK